MRIRFCLDSGAYSLFTTKCVGYDGEGRMIRGSSAMSEKTRKYDFYDTKEFYDYVQGYMDYVKFFGKAFEFHVTVDVIFNHERTDKVLKIFDKAGLTPLPVLHYNTPHEYLVKWADRYPYIGIGGVPRNTTLVQYINHGNEVFKYFGNTKAIKTHGFALTAFQLLSSMPWYSVDSTSPSVHGRFGNVMLPKLTRHRNRLVTDYSGMNQILVVSERRRDHKDHFHKAGPVFSSAVHEYLESLGTSVEEVTNEHLARDVCNYVWVDRHLTTVKERTGRAPQFYKSGKYSSAPTRVPELIRRMADNGVKELNYMGTYFRLDGMRVINKLLDDPVFLTIRQYKKAIRHGRKSLYQSLKPQFSLSPSAGVHASPDVLLLRGKPRLRVR